MTKDIVERLRMLVDPITAPSYMWEAARVIERLREELNSATLEQAWAERNAAVAELFNYKETIRHAKREVLLDAANIISLAVGQPGNDWGEGYTAATEDICKGLRRISEELK